MAFFPTEPSSAGSTRPSPSDRRLRCTLALALLGAAATPLACGTAAPGFVDVKEEILSPNCSSTSCHGGEGPQRDLKLDGDDAYEQLVNADATVSGWAYVVPGDPDASLLYVAAAEGLDAEGVRQMPPGFPLTEEKLDLLRAWIESGAENN